MVQQNTDGHITTQRFWNTTGIFLGIALVFSRSIRNNACTATTGTVNHRQCTEASHSVYTCRSLLQGSHVGQKCKVHHTTIPCYNGVKPSLVWWTENAAVDVVCGQPIDDDCRTRPPRLWYISSSLVHKCMIDSSKWRAMQIPQAASYFLKKKCTCCLYLAKN